MKTFILSLFVMLALSACGGGNDAPAQSYRTATANTPAFIQKGAVFTAIKGMEATPIVFNNELLYVGTRPHSGGVNLVVLRQSDSTVLADWLAGMEFVSAIVNNGTLYVFGNTGGRTQISVTSTSDLINWTPKQVVYTAPAGRNVFNNSVAADATGFVMAYETCDQNQVCFNARFMRSSDLINWTAAGGVYEPGYYTACPTIRYSNGYYYMLFLSAFHSNNGTYYATNIARSTDLTHWQFSQMTVISPLDGDYAMNASDMDLVEYNGQVRIVYSNISQYGQYVPGTGLREATYNGSIDQFFAEFF